MSRNEDEFKSRGLIFSDFHLPYNPDLKDRAKWMRKRMTTAEKKLWADFLKDIEYKILPQRPIDNFIVDFYCPKAKVIIEIDGDGHYVEDGIEYDKERTAILEGYGLRVIRFKNEEVMKQFEEVCLKIEEFLTPPF